MNIQPFIFAQTPCIHFGKGVFDQLRVILPKFGKRVLVITGGSSFKNSGKFEQLLSDLKKQSLQVFDFSVQREPSPELVDQAVLQFKDEKIDVVAAIGGGSALDAGKAISAMLLQNTTVLDYLEGVGSGKVHNGVKVPFVAVPTTSGTGSESTKNAVLSRVGKDGFKKSLRHDRFVPDIAIVDPVLTLSCPPHITAASGMDAFSQLLEAYVSTNASPMTDAIALQGLAFVKECLVPVCTTQADNIDMRAGMSYAALVSGIALANAGLGVVHGLASPIGGSFDIPHGVICGTMVGEMVKTNIALLLQAGEDKKEYLKKYAKVGALFSGANEENTERCCEELVRIIERWVEVLRIPRLGEYGITAEDLDKIVAGAGNKNNPVNLDKRQMKQLMLNRL